MTRPPATPLARHLGFALAGYTALTLVLHAGIVSHLATRVLSGSFVGGIFAWEFSWFSHCWSAGTNPFFTTSLMHPAGTPIVVESPWNAALGAALTEWIGPYRSVNVLFLANYVLSATALAALAYDETRDATASFVAGFLFAFGQYSVVQHLMGHLHESTLYGPPLLILGARKALRGDRGAPALFALGLALTTLSSTYLALEFGLIGLTLYVWGDRAWKSPPAAARLRRMTAAIAVVIAAAVLSYLPVLVWRHELIGGGKSYSLSLLSFIDFPAWNPWAWMQTVRVHTAGFSEPENLMGYFGISTVLLLALGARQGAFKSGRAWVAMTIGGLILSFGPRLQWAYRGGGPPMPYALLRALPFLSLFRAPARMIALTWLAGSVLAAKSFSAVTANMSPAKRTACAAGLLIFFGAEMGLWVLDRQWTAPLNGPVAERLSLPTRPGALLVLPASIDDAGEISVDTERSMLDQPAHGRALTLGRPVRYTAASLAAIRRSPALSVLTQPGRLKSMVGRPDFGKFAAAVNADLAVSRTAYVMFRSRERLFDPAAMAAWNAVLERAFGLPVVTDDDGNRLYAVNPAP